MLQKTQTSTQTELVCPRCKGTGIAKSWGRVRYSPGGYDEIPPCAYCAGTGMLSPVPAMIKINH